MHRPPRELILTTARSHAYDARLRGAQGDGMMMRSSPDQERLMVHVGVNWAAIGVAALAKFVQGWLWFSPVLFYKPWKRLSGVTDESMKHGMGAAIAIWVFGALLTSFILANFVHWTHTTTAVRGVGIAFHVWLGFVLVFMMDDYAAEKRPFALIAIKAGNQLVGLLIMGAILGGWQ